MQGLLQPVLANVAILDGVGSDKGGETTGAQQVVNTPDEIGDEIAQAREQGFADMLLGPRVLRTETAGLTAITALQCRFGDLA